MIVDLDLQDRMVVVIGGGGEAQKRINSILKQGCKILVVSDSINPQIAALARAKKIRLQRQKVRGVRFLSKLKPHMVIATTDDGNLNLKIINWAKKRGTLAYSSDNPDDSDFSNPAVIDLEGTVQIAIFTGGRSPAMAKKIRAQSEKIFRKVVTKEDIARIKIQEVVRRLARVEIHTQNQRKKYLQRVMDDKIIDQLIKDGQIKKAEKLAIAILRDWK